MTAKATERVAERVVERLRAADYVGLTEHYAPDALFDLNAPHWRFQLQGRDAIRAFGAEEHGSLRNLHCTQLRELVTDDAVVVESECRFDGADGEYLWRAIDVLRIVADEIVEHTQYCTGNWSPTEIARQSAQAPMVRW